MSTEVTILTYIATVVFGAICGILFWSKIRPEFRGWTPGVGWIAAAVALNVIFAFLTVVYAKSNAVSPSPSDMPVGTEDPQLKALLDYTVFHIGVYLTIATGLLAAMNYKLDEKHSLSLLIPILAFVCAGGAGGMLGSHVPDSKDFKAFAANNTIKFLDLDWLPTKYAEWAILEHQMFWFGVISLVVLLALRPLITPPNASPADRLAAAKLIAQEVQNL